jgi:hypothetical protein
LSTASPLDRLEPQLANYLAMGILVFPCRGRDQPLVRGGFYGASRDPGLVASWWRRFPDAWVVIRTGAKPSGSGIVVIDVDPENGGFDTLAGLIGPELPRVPTVHTPTYPGLHFWYAYPDRGCISTVGKGGKRRKGLGPGLDVKADLSQVHAPGGSPRSPYRWDEIYNLNTLPLIPLPAVLTPVEIPDDEEETTAARPRRPIARPDAYAEKALSNACERIRNAPPGEQRNKLNGESLSMGSLAAGIGLDHAWVTSELIAAGMVMANQAGRAPWRRHEVRDVVMTGFRDGLRNPKTPQRRSR